MKYTTYIISIGIIASALFSQSLLVNGQTVNLETSVLNDSAHQQTISFQRVEVNTKVLNFKYDYKASGRDVLGIIIPKVWSDSANTLSAMFVKTGDGGPADQFAFDFWLSSRWGGFNSLIEAGRVIGESTIPRDYYGGRWNYGNFTLEFYQVNSHPVNEKFTGQDANYGWIGYHPKHTFLAIGKQDKQYWAFAGTKNLKKFGTFNFFNYQPKNGDFWFRSQSGFGEINQDFFCQDLYVTGTEYLVVPLFYFKHFSPICAKGSYSLRLDARRAGKIQNYEVIMGKEVGEKWFRLAAGVTSEYREALRIAPALEFYKDWKGNHGRLVTEVRYDFLYNAVSVYLTARY